MYDNEVILIVLVYSETDVVLVNVIVGNTNDVVLSLLDYMPYISSEIDEIAIIFSEMIGKP
jgi:hypothetical protein